MNSVLKRLNEKASRNRVPIMAALELLPVCNLQCKMCYVRKSMDEVQAGGGLKDAAWWLDLAAQARDAGLLSPLLTGGEPLLHPQFREIFLGLKEMGMQVSLNSNGTLMDRDGWAQWFGAHRPTRINITLYGASAESYERLCGSGAAYDHLRRGLEQLKENGVPVKFNTSVTPENVADLEKIVAFAQDYGAPLQAATYMFPPLRRNPDMVGKNDRLSPEQAALCKVKVDYFQQTPERFVGQTLAYRRFVPLDQIQEHKEAVPLKMHCRAGLSSFWIDWQGNLINCGMYGSAGACLDGRDFQTAWRELVEKTAQVRYAPACAACPNVRLCHPCCALIYSELGGFEGRPDYVCRMQQAQSKYYLEYARKYYPDLLKSYGAEHREEAMQDDCEF